MGFGPMLLQLIRTFFVLNNGFVTDLFPVIRGVRQGNPLSVVCPHIGNTQGMSNRS